MNERQARELIGNLVVITQKTRSNLIEGMSGHRELQPSDEKVLQYLHPKLFPKEGHVGILESLIFMQQKPYIPPLDVYNILTLVEHSLAIQLMACILNVELPPIHPLPSWLDSWKVDK